jgi:hypothetical protein
MPESFAGSTLKVMHLPWFMIYEASVTHKYTELP